MLKLRTLEESQLNTEAGRETQLRSALHTPYKRRRNCNGVARNQTLKQASKEAHRLSRGKRGLTGSARERPARKTSADNARKRNETTAESDGRGPTRMRSSKRPPQLDPGVAGMDILTDATSRRWKEASKPGGNEGSTT